MLSIRIKFVRVGVVVGMCGVDGESMVVSSTTEGQSGQAYLLDLIHGCGNGWTIIPVVEGEVTLSVCGIGPRKVACGRVRELVVTISQSHALNVICDNADHVRSGDGLSKH